ncbi:MAG TPA: DUF2336 domain-containing protein [Devosia sp.]|nr:DUF2336 domain-containing protein [Devosia sp.]
MLEDLVGLARETSSEKRRELMERVADLFVEGSEKYTDRELGLFGEVMSKLLEKSNATSRAELSEKVSRDANTPRDVALQLADDEIEIARPMLENSPNLTSDDLMSLVSSKGTEHRVAISGRSDLNVEITDELIQHGECEVLRAISGNQYAPVSDWGFGAIAEQASGDAQIQANLASRKDMSLAAAKNVLPLLPPGAQQQLMGLLEDDTGELVALVGQAVRDTSVKNIENKIERIDAMQLLGQVKEGERSLDSVISYLAKQDRPMDCAMVISKLSKMPEEQVASSLLKINGQGIALLCKAINIGREAFHDLARMRYARLSLPSSKADELALAYEDVDAGIAQRTLRFVSMKNSVSMAV